MSQVSSVRQTDGPSESLAVPAHRCVALRPRRRGWTQTLQRCLAGPGAEGAEGAELCFLQQAAFGDRRLQQANSGVVVFGGRRSSVASAVAFFQALAARLQAQEVVARLLPHHDAVAFEQLLMNYVLNDIRKWKEKEKEERQKEGEWENELERLEDSTPRLVRWGIYNPLVAYAGMFLTHAVLTNTVHHATASNVDLKQKLRLMDSAQLFVADLRSFCPGPLPDGRLPAELPLPAFCYYFTGVDPHFGPLLDHFRVHGGFSEQDNMVVIDHLQRRQLCRKLGRVLLHHLYACFGDVYVG